MVVVVEEVDEVVDVEVLVVVLEDVVVWRPYGETTTEAAVHSSAPSIVKVAASAVSVALVASVQTPTVGPWLPPSLYPRLSAYAAGYTLTV